MEQAEILARIEELEKQLKEVKGEVCEVWARVVGYMRPVKAWNEGKVSEYKDRAMFDETVKK